jgi:hypothetical protein
MDKRKIEIVIAVLILLGVIVLLWFLLQKESDKIQRDSQPEPVAIDDTFFDEVMVDVAPVMMPQPIARTFVERFASFSTEADYSNVDDVLPIVTSDLRIALQDIAEEARAEQSGAYYGVSTSVITISISEETETTATLAITTQREEAFGNPGNTAVRYQDIELQMIRDGDEWFVSAFTWK